MSAKVIKRGGTWQAFSPGGVWLGASSHWDVALALALGEPVDAGGRRIRSGSLSGIKTIMPGYQGGRER